MDEIRIPRRWFRTAVAAMAGLIVVLVVQACNLTEGDVINRLEATAFAEVTTTTQYYCGNETFEIAWDGGEQLSSCTETSGPCKSASLAISPEVPGFSGFLDDQSPNALNGSATISAVGIEGPIEVHYTVNTGSGGPAGIATDTLTIQPLDDDEVEIQYYYDFECRDGTWDFAQRIEPGEEGFPYCSAVTGINNPSGAGLEFEGRSSASQPSGWSGTVNPNTFDIYEPDNSLYGFILRPNFEDIPGYGESCSPGDTPPESYHVGVRVDCGAPEDLQYPQCSDNSVDASGGELACVRSETCGDYVCDTSCETDINCAIDCGCNNDGVCNTFEASSGVCADCAGVFCGDGFCSSPDETADNCPDDCTAATSGDPYCGSPCTTDADCSGLGVNPICTAGGTCYDGGRCDTDSPSFPGNPSDPDSPNVDEPNLCEDVSCGDGACQSWCGESSMNCAEDCFG